VEEADGYCNAGACKGAASSDNVVLGPVAPAQGASGEKDIEVLARGCDALIFPVPPEVPDGTAGLGSC